MHYGATDFGIRDLPNNKPRTVITTIDPAKQSLIGQREKLSDIDIAELNDIYGYDY